MMKRPRLSRLFCVGILAAACLLALSYWPLSRIRAANAGATILPSAAKPLVNLKNPQTLKVTYAGPADAVAALQRGTAIPTALAEADFDADGAMDVVAGYSTSSSGKSGGLLVLFRGNPDAYAPNDPTFYAKALKGNVPPTLLSQATVFRVPQSPDLILTGDFNHDGYKDVLVATRGGSLYLLAGDGRGNLLSPQIVPLSAQVMAMDVTGDGHVGVSVDSPNGPQLVILSPGAQGLISGASFTLPARGNAVAWGNLGGGADVAVGAGTNVVMIYNALRTNPQTETVPVPFQVEGLTVGDFIWDQDARSEISVLGDDGSIHILQHGTLNTAPLTATQIPGRRAAMLARSKQPSNPTAIGRWSVAKQVPHAGSAPAGAVSPSAFNSPHLAEALAQDLMVLDAGRNQLSILDTSGTAASASAAVSFSGTPVAALALPQKINAGRDIVVLAAGQAAPTIITANSDPTFNVTWTADEDDANACNNSSIKSGTGADGNLSLREAVCEANNNGAAVSVINVPAGTFDLTSLETGDLQVGNTQFANISIIGSGSSSTIVQQTDGHDRIIEQDPGFVGDIAITISNLSLVGGSCTSGTDCTYGGSAVLGGGPDGAPDNVTLTNVVVSHNTAGYAGDGQNGGALDLSDAGTYTFTNCTFSSNTAVYDSSSVSGGAGGAIYATNGASQGNMTITNCTFTGNVSQNGGGGAINSVMSAGDTTTISGSTFTGNSALDDAADGGAQGGAIHADGDMTISNSRIVGNTDGDGSSYGTGLYASNTGGFSVVATNNWWGCNGGPGASGCDTIDDELGTLSFNPWLVLSLSASSTQILPNGTSELTADLTHDSNGIGGFSVPNGTSVAFGGGSLGTTFPTSTTLTNGTASSTFTAGSAAGNDTATATVDSATVDATINILDTVTVATNPTGLSFTVDSVTYTAAQTFNWVVGSSHTISTTSPQAGPAGSQYAFSSWSDAGGQSHSVTAPAAATSYTASFTTQYQLTTQASPSADGSVTPVSGGYYAGGTIVPVTATANAGFQFSNWTSTGGTFVSTTAPSTNFTMPGMPATVTGNFAPVIVAASTTTTVTSNNNPSFTTAPGNSVTFTATVSSTSTVNEGTVTFTAGVNNLTCSGGNPVPVSSGQAQCTTSFSAEGTQVITATYNGTVNFQPSNGTVSQVVNNHTVQTGNQFCNPGLISIPNAAGGATPYPSNIFVSGISGNIGAVTVTLNNISSSNIPQTDLLLVGPTGAEIIPFASVGDGSTISSVNITLDDAATSALPGGSPLGSGTFQPTSLTGSTSLVFPAPAPAVVAADYAASDGPATLASQFGNTAPNGTWALYAMTSAANGAASIGGGWCVNITPPAVPITITTSPANLLVSVDGGTFTAAPLVESWVPGSSHTIATSSPQAGGPGVQYVFSNWSDSGAISHSITVPSSAATYTATFNTQYQLTTQASPSADGTVTPSSGNFYAAGAIVPVTATANAGFQFTNWTATGGTFVSTTSPSTNFTMPSAPATVTGNFASATVSITITTSPANLLVSADGGPFTAAPLAESWNIGSSHTITTTSPQAGGAGVQYVWSNWSDSGAISHSITVPSTATTYTATFGTQYQLTTAANPSNGGTVSPTSGSFYAAGAVVPITATPNAGYTFSSWTGNVANPTSPTTTVTMSAPESVIANFTAPQVSLKPTSINFGTEYLYNLRVQNVRVENVGTATLNISNVSLTLGSGTNANNFRFDNFCPAHLAPGKSCRIAVFFFADQVGSPTATLNITDNAPGSPQQVPLSATVINPKARFNPQALHFGTVHVGNSSTKSVTLTNSGTTALGIFSIGVTGVNAGDYMENNACPSSLAPGSDCTITVTFTPSATGLRSAALTVMDNTQAGTQNVPLSGTGSE